MSPVEEFVTSRFFNLYGPPDAFDPKAFVAEYAKALNGTDADILREASDRIVRKHKYRNWPTVGECVEVVQFIAEQRMLARRREAWGYGRDQHETPTPEAKARMDEIVKQAAEYLTSVSKPVRMPLPAVDRESWNIRLAHSPTARALARIHDEV
jgi:nucleoside-diphosphate-sugar epimerase